MTKAVFASVSAVVASLLLVGAAAGQEASSPELIARGKALVSRHCAVCHAGHDDRRQPQPERAPVPPFERTL